MNANTISQLAAASLAGSLPFPAFVGGLIAEGVEYYHVDYVRREFVFHGAESIVVVPLTLADLPGVAQTFDAPALKAAILDSQQNGQKFTQFSARAVRAGVQSCYAFLLGKRVTYLGRLGDQHTEWFPGAGQ